MSYDPYDFRQLFLFLQSFTGTIVSHCCKYFETWGGKHVETCSNCRVTT